MSGSQDAHRNRVLPLSSILTLKGVGGPVSRGSEVAGPWGLRRPWGEGGGAKTPLLAFQDASGVQARSRARPHGGSELQGGARRKRRLPAGGPRRGRWANKGELARSVQAPPSTLEAERQAWDSQSQKARGCSNLGPRDSILHQTVSRLPVANHVFLGS